MELGDSEQNVRNSLLPTEIPPGSSVLVRGPAISGKYTLLLTLLAATDGEPLLVSTSQRADRARSVFESYGDAERLAVVDCVTRVQGDEGAEGSLLRYAASPKNLTEIGVKFTDLVDSYEERDTEDVVVGIHSLSELLMYSNVERVFQFLRIMGAECQNLDWPLVAVVDDAAVGEEAVATLSQPFDTVVSTRITDDGNREFAVTSDDEPEWCPF